MERTSVAKTPEWRNVDLKTLRGEIIPRDRPAVLKGLVEHWPIARASAQSPQALHRGAVASRGTIAPGC